MASCKEECGGSGNVASASMADERLLAMSAGGAASASTAAYSGAHTKRAGVLATGICEYGRQKAFCKE
eukprot:3882223-Pleurochrysis_carterae.AAC.2